jgi:hypothetical protein
MLRGWNPDAPDAKNDWIADCVSNGQKVTILVHLEWGFEQREKN